MSQPKSIPVTRSSLMVTKRGSSGDNPACFSSLADLRQGEILRATERRPGIEGMLGHGWRNSRWCRVKGAFRGPNVTEVPARGTVNAWVVPISPSSAAMGPKIAARRGSIISRAVGVHQRADQQSA
eukprot:6179738-Pleurochrysis_carterae.AAC.3